MFQEASVLAANARPTGAALGSEEFLEKSGRKPVRASLNALAEEPAMAARTPMGGGLLGGLKGTSKHNENQY